MVLTFYRGQMHVKLFMLLLAVKVAAPTLTNPDPALLLPASNLGVIYEEKIGLPQSATRT